MMMDNSHFLSNALICSSLLSFSRNANSGSSLRCGLGLSHALEPFECVADEWQTHVCCVVVTQCLGLRTMLGRCVILVDFVNWEVRDIDVRFKIGLEGCTDGA